MRDKRRSIPKNAQAKKHQSIGLHAHELATGMRTSKAKLRAVAEDIVTDGVTITKCAPSKRKPNIAKRSTNSW